MLAAYVPILVLLVIAAGLATALLVVARVLGPSRPSPEKMKPYESGMDPASTPKIRFNIQFYRIAMLFLVFDIEAAFFYPWAVLFRDLSCTSRLQQGMCSGATSPFGILVMVVFMAILMLALVYVWRKRALEWD